MILIILIGISGALVAALCKPEIRERHWPWVLGAVSFVILVAGNLLWPDFAPMGERLRDYAILSSVMQDPLTPQEPWFSGFPLNYYLNWYRVGALFGFLGFAPWEVYHLLGPLTMSIGIASTALLLCSWISVTPLIASILSVTMWLGSNVSGFIDVLRGDHNWWGPSRVITGAINEFPAWSWLLGDLHPHYLNLCALPLILVLTRKLSGWPFILALVALLGWNYSANAWDVAPGLVLVLVMLVSEYSHLLKISRQWKLSLYLFILTGIFFCTALHLKPLHTPLRFVDWAVSWQIYAETFLGHLPLTIEPHVPGVLGSKISEFFLHWGVPLGLIILGTLLRLTSISRAVLTGLICIAVIATHSVLVLLFGVVIIVMVFDWSRLTRGHALLIATLLIIAVPEVVFFDDPYGGEVERMNTIFKFYSYAWIPLMIGAWCWVYPFLRDRYAQVLAFTIAIIMLPWTAQTIGDRKQNNFILQPKAQGLSYFERTYPGSGRVIQKLSRQPRGTTVEAENGAYSDGDFICTLASQPCFLGWANHVGLLLNNPPELGRRQQVIRDLYAGDCAHKQEIMKGEQIAYLVVGEIERRIFPQITIPAFECLRVVLKEGNTTIYGVG